MGGCAPYFSRAGMFKSSTKITNRLPAGAPKTPLRRLSNCENSLAQRSYCLSNQRMKQTTTKTNEKKCRKCYLGVQQVLHLVGLRTGRERQEQRIVILGQAVHQLAHNGDSLTGTGLTDTQHALVVRNEQLQQVRVAHGVRGRHNDVRERFLSCQTLYGGMVLIQSTTDAAPGPL